MLTQRQALVHASATIPHIRNCGTTLRCCHRCTGVRPSRGLDPRSRFSRALGDVDRVRTCAPPSGRAGTGRTAHRATRAQMAAQLMAQVATGLNAQGSVDGLVRHAHHCAGQEPAPQHPSICCGDHSLSSFSSTIAGNPGNRESLVGLFATSPLTVDGTRPHPAAIAAHPPVTTVADLCSPYRSRRHVRSRFANRRASVSRFGSACPPPSHRGSGTVWSPRRCRCRTS